MIRKNSNQMFQGSVAGDRYGSSSNQNTQLGETQASFNARMGNLQNVIGSVQGIGGIAGLTQSASQ